MIRGNTLQMKTARQGWSPIGKLCTENMIHCSMSAADQLQKAEGHIVHHRLSQAAQHKRNERNTNLEMCIYTTGAISRSYDLSNKAEDRRQENGHAGLSKKMDGTESENSHIETRSTTLWRVIRRGKDSRARKSKKICDREVEESPFSVLKKEKLRLEVDGACLHFVCCEDCYAR